MQVEMKKAPIALLAVLASCAATDGDAWRTHDFGPFSLCLPPDFVEDQVRGIDSYVRQWSSPGMRLSFDYGRWSYVIDGYWPEGTKVERVDVDGKPARIATAHHDFGREFPYSTMLEVRELRPHVHLSVFVNCSTPEDFAVARRIFLSIRFKPE